MPLIIMTGFPSAGKSTAAKKIQQYFSEHGKEAEILSEGSFWEYFSLLHMYRIHSFEKLANPYRKDILIIFGQIR